jgi:uncharacterized protein YoxC
MITANIYEIAAFIVALAFLVLVIFAIPALIQIKTTARSVEEITGQSKKTIEALNTLIKKAGEGTGELDILIKRLKDLSNRLSTTAEFISLNIKSPLVTALSLIIGFQYGLKYFMKSTEEKCKKHAKDNEKGGDREKDVEKEEDKDQRDQIEKGAGEDVKGQG